MLVIVARAFAVAFLAAAAAGAQDTRAWLDAGASSVRYADDVSASSLTLSPGVRVAGARAAFGAFGLVTKSSGASTLSGTVYGSVTPFSAGRVSMELGGSGGGSSHSDGTATGQVLGTGRLYLNAKRGGAWIGAGVGQTSDGATWRGLAQGNLGAWMASDATAGILTVLPTSVEGSIRYTDAMVTVQRYLARMELSASLGSRFGDPIPSLVSDRVWGHASATAWLAPGVGIVASGGTYPVDFTQGFPGGRYVSLALRLQRARTRPDVAATPAAASASMVRAFQARRAGAQLELRVLAPNARSVEIAGDFTRWEPVALRPEGNGWWSTSRAMSAGAHELSVRADGGAWEAPPGLVAVRDEFGGHAGVLVVR